MMLEAFTILTMMDSGERDQGWNAYFNKKKEHIPYLTSRGAHNIAGNMESGQGHVELT